MAVTEGPGPCYWELLDFSVFNVFCPRGHCPVGVPWPPGVVGAFGLSPGLTVALGAQQPYCLVQTQKTALMLLPHQTQNQPFPLGFSPRVIGWPFVCLALEEIWNLVL